MGLRLVTRQTNTATVTCKNTGLNTEAVYLALRSDAVTGFQSLGRTERFRARRATSRAHALRHAKVAALAMTLAITAGLNVLASHSNASAQGPPCAAESEAAHDGQCWAPRR